MRKEQITIIKENSIQILTPIAQGREIQRRHPCGRRMKHCFPFPCVAPPKIQPLHHGNHNFAINIGRKGI
jgi:hypothetical protein